MQLAEKYSEAAAVVQGKLGSLVPHSHERLYLQAKLTVKFHDTLDSLLSLP